MELGAVIMKLLIPVSFVDQAKRLLIICFKIMKLLMEESSPLLVSQGNYRETVVLKKLCQLLQEN